MTAVVAVARRLAGAGLLMVGLLSVPGGCKDKDKAVPPVDTEIHPPELPDCEVLWRVAALATDPFCGWSLYSERPNQPLVQDLQLITWAGVGTGRIGVQAVERATGEVLWSYSSSHAHGCAAGRFAHSMGQVYVPEWTDAHQVSLRALLQASGEVSWVTRQELRDGQELAADELGLYAYEQREAGIWLIALDPTSGSRLAEVDLTGYEVLFSPSMTARGVVVFTLHEVLLFASGTLVPLGSFERDGEISSYNVVSPPGPSMGRLVFWQDNLGVFQIVALDLESSESVESVQEPAGGRFGVVEGDLYWTSSGPYSDDYTYRSISLLDGTEERFNLDWLAEDYGVVSVSADRLAYFAGESGVWVFDRASGEPLCHQGEVERTNNSQVPIIADGVLYVPGEEELFALRLP